jgi:hypothetical protein
MLEKICAMNVYLNILDSNVTLFYSIIVICTAGVNAAPGNKLCGSLSQLKTDQLSQHCITTDNKK